MHSMHAMNESSSVSKAGAACKPGFAHTAGQTFNLMMIDAIYEAYLVIANILLRLMPYPFL